MPDCSRRPRAVLLLGFIGLLLTSGPAALAKNLYVAASGGNDSVSYADNSVTKPWSTLQRALCGAASCSSPNAGQAAQAGDIVLVSPGTYVVGPATGDRLVPAIKAVNKGSAGSPITIRKNGTGVVDLRHSGSAAGPVFGCSNNQYVVWDGMYAAETPTQNRSTSDTGPVVFWVSSGCQLLNSEVVGTLITRQDNYPGVRIEDSDTITVSNNKIHGFNHTAGDNALHNACGIQIYGCANCMFENNEIYDAGAGWYGKDRTDRVTVRYNLIYDTGEGVFFSGQLAGYNRVYQNVIRDNDTCFTMDYSVIDTYFVNNTCARNSRAGALPWTNHHPTYCKSSADPRLGYGSSGTECWSNINIYNNIYYGTGDASTDHAAVNGENISDTQDNRGGHGDYNIAYNYKTFARFNWNNYASPSAFFSVTDASAGGAGIGWEQHSTITNPLFVNASANDFRLQTSSPARNAGLDILDLDKDGSTSDTITAGAYITGTEQIGLLTGPPAPNTAPSPVMGLIRVDVR